MGLAVSRMFKTREGDRREETLFINVTAWRGTAEYCNEKLRKGRPILVEGRLKSDEWEDKNTGQKRTSIEVHAERVQNLDWDGPPQGGSRPEPRSIEEPIPEDDIPF